MALEMLLHVFPRGSSSTEHVRIKDLLNVIEVFCVHRSNRGFHLCYQPEGGC